MPSKVVGAGVGKFRKPLRHRRLAERCKPLRQCDILPQQAAISIEIFPVCSKIYSIKENAPLVFIPVSGAISRIDHASRRVSAHAAKLQVSSWFIPGKAGTMKGPATAAWLDDAAAAQKPKPRWSMFGRHLFMPRSNPARWFAHVRAAMRHQPRATLTFGNPGAMIRQIIAPNS